MIEWMMLACNPVSQAAVEAAITGPRNWLADLPAEFQANRDVVANALSQVKGMRFTLPQGGPFLLPDVTQTGMGGNAFAELLIDEYGLRVSGGSYYDAPDCIRIPFGGTHSALLATVDRIDDAVNRLRQ